MTDFQTKPDPKQPDRCPSIDPHDVLQCGRSIHTDDNCRLGGISWKKGSPRYVSDREQLLDLQKKLKAIIGTHEYEYTELDTGVRKCRHSDHKYGYTGNCMSAALREQFPELYNGAL